MPALTPPAPVYDTYAEQPQSTLAATTHTGAPLASRVDPSPTAVVIAPIREMGVRLPRRCCDMACAQAVHLDRATAQFDALQILTMYMQISHAELGTAQSHVPLPVHSRKLLARSPSRTRANSSTARLMTACRDRIFTARDRARNQISERSLYRLLYRRQGSLDLGRAPTLPGLLSKISCTMPFR